MAELQKQNSSFGDFEVEKLGAKIKNSLPGLEKTSFDYKSLAHLDQFLEKGKEKNTSSAALTDLPNIYSHIYGLPIFDPRKNKNKELIGHCRITSKSQIGSSMPGDARLEALAGDEEEGQLFLAIYTNPEKYIEVVISLNEKINFAFYETQNGLTKLDTSYFIEGEQPEIGRYRKNKFLYKSWAGNHDIVSLFTNEKPALATAIMGETSYNSNLNTKNLLPGVNPYCYKSSCSGVVPPPSPPPSPPPPSTAAVSTVGIVSVLEGYINK